MEYVYAVCLCQWAFYTDVDTVTECSKHGEMHMETASVKGGVSASKVGRRTIRMRVLSSYLLSCNARRAVSPHHDDSATSCSCQAHSDGIVVWT